MIELDLPELARRLSDPAAPEALAKTMVVVAIEQSHDIELVDGLIDLMRPVPCIFVAVVGDVASNASLPPIEAAFDIILGGAPKNETVPQCRIESAIEALKATLVLAPVAATSLVLLLRAQAATLRSSGTAAVVAALSSESALYSTLQAGAEFGTWRSQRPQRPAAERQPRVRISRTDDRLHITLTRADKRNALDALMRDELSSAFQLGVADERLEILVDGEGPDFCSGGDLDEFGSRPDPAEAHTIRMARSLPWSIERLSPRIEVRVHGACYGAGIELPAFAHRVVAAPDAMFALPEIRFGLIPGSGGTVSITRRVGRHRTAYLALSGTPIDATTALAWGLIDEVTSDSVRVKSGGSYARSRL